MGILLLKKTRKLRQIQLHDKTVYMLRVSPLLAFRTLCPPVVDSNGREAWHFNEFCGFILSDENCLENKEKVKVHQDMTLSMSNYWINTSHDSFLSHWANKEASVKAYEVLLRQGVRCISLDVHNGKKEMPYVFKKGLLGASTNKLELASVLRTIKENAFVASDYPLIITLGVYCNEKSQASMAQLFKDVFGDRLVTKKLSPQENALPSPEALKGKIILSSSVARTDAKEEPNEFYLGEVWVRAVNKNGREWKLSKVTLFKTLVLEEYMTDKGPELRHGERLRLQVTTRDQNSVGNEQYFDVTEATVSKQVLDFDELNHLIRHNTKVIVTLPNQDEVEMTKENEVESLLRALQKQIVTGIRQTEGRFYEMFRVPNTIGLGPSSVQQEHKSRQRSCQT